jgi:hypothetical protein
VSGATLPAADYAQLLAPAKEQKAGAPPVFALTVPTWTESAAKGLLLRVHECDFEGAPDPTFSVKGAREPKTKTLVVELALDLEKHAPAADDDPAAPVGWVVSKAKVTKGKDNVLGTTKVERKGKPRSTGTREGADFTLLLGETRFHIKVPDDDGFHDEGAFYELGWELTDAKGEHRHARLRDAECALVPAPDPLAVMRGLAVKPMGALVKQPDGKPLPEPFVDPKKAMGRFGDPARAPSVAPADVARLDDLTLAALKQGATPVDVDGLSFAKLVKSGDRRDLVERLAKENQTVRAAIAGASKDWPLHTKDIRKAYFIIHDIGLDPPSAPRKKGHYGEGKGQKSVAGEGVHGFLNHDGSYAVSRDFASPRGRGTVYENLKEGAWMGPYGINIETVPIGISKKDLAKVREAEAAGKPWPKGVTATHEGYALKDVACTGAQTVHKVEYAYLWTHAMLDALADLYVFASARAAHLLTVTGHLEVDRNVILSKVFFEHTKSQVAGFTGYYETHRNGARNGHGDPYGIDLQVFYDKITAKLNALGGLQLPKGARYGIHPRRVTTADGDGIGNSDGYLHTFPYQSAPEVQRLHPSLQRGTVSDWAQSIRPIYGDGGKHGRKVVTGFEGTPWWAR